MIEPNYTDTSIKENIVLNTLYNQYVYHLNENYPNFHVFSFDEILNNVYNGIEECTKEEDITKTYILENVYNVLKAMIYNARNSVDDYFLI